LFRNVFEDALLSRQGKEGFVNQKGKTIAQFRKDQIESEFMLWQ